MIADFTGSANCMMTVNGTVSLTIALLALGLKNGDEVLVPNLTMIASPNAAALVGIVPVLVDIEEDTLCMDLHQAQEALTPKTKALMYVPFNGRSGDMEKVVQFCKKHRLSLIEDAAQALGSYYKGKHLGTFGAFGSFSFSVPKVITTGQGGALVSDDALSLQKARKLKDFGRSRGGIDIHDEWGWNFKFTDIQAVIGIEQIKKLPWRLKRKKEIFKRYKDGLADLKDIQFIPTDLENTSPWFVDIFVREPDTLLKFLKKESVESRRIYPAVHLQNIYRKSYAKKAFPISEHYASLGLWLPSSSKLKDEEIDYVISVIREYYNAQAKSKIKSKK